MVKYIQKNEVRPLPHNKYKNQHKDLKTYTTFVGGGGEHNSKYSKPWITSYIYFIILHVWVFASMYLCAPHVG